MKKFGLKYEENSLIIGVIMIGLGILAYGFGVTVDVSLLVGLFISVMGVYTLIHGALSTSLKFYLPWGFIMVLTGVTIGSIRVLNPAIPLGAMVIGLALLAILFRYRRVPSSR